MKCKYDFCQNEVVNNFHVKLFCCVKCKNKYNVDKRRWEIKIKAVKYKGGKCEKCGYNKCMATLEFHHINPEIKEFGISKLPHTRSWERTKVEVDKCQLLCANCHREEEFEKKSKHKKFILDLIEKYKI